MENHRIEKKYSYSPLESSAYPWTNSRGKFLNFKHATALSLNRYSLTSAFDCLERCSQTSPLRSSPPYKLDEHRYDFSFPTTGCSSSWRLFFKYPAPSPIDPPSVPVLRFANHDGPEPFLVRTIWSFFKKLLFPRERIESLIFYSQLAAKAFAAHDYLQYNRGLEICTKSSKYSAREGPPFWSLNPVLLCVQFLVSTTNFKWTGKKGRTTLIKLNE